jgi:hypothetical protein
LRVMPAVASLAELMELDMRAWIRECKREPLIRHPRPGGAPRSPAALPAGATHRSNGRGVDADAGQGNVLRRSNHRTPWVSNCQ